MCDAVFPLVWSFLLEPSRIDPSSTTGSIDFKSIRSFMLVSKSAKEAFDASNGWALCLRAIKQEITVKEEFILRASCIKLSSLLTNENSFIYE